MGILGIFPINVTTYVHINVTRSMTQKGGLMSAHSLKVQFTLVGVAWGYEFVASGQGAFTGKKPRSECWLSASFLLCPGPHLME